MNTRHGPWCLRISPQAPAVRQKRILMLRSVYKAHTIHSGRHRPGSNRLASGFSDPPGFKWGVKDQAVCEKPLGPRSPATSCPLPD